jgi:hypothetical protein
MKLSKHYYIFLSVFILTQLYSYAKKDSLYTSFSSRLIPGIYTMGNIITTNNTDIYFYQLKPNKVTGYKITGGINSEIKISDRRSVRIGMLFSELAGEFQGFSENIAIKYSGYGSSFFLKTKIFSFESPLEFKYTLIKNKSKSKLKPYLLIGISPVFSYKIKYTYKSNGGTTIDHTEVRKKIESRLRRLILTLGLNYEITDKVNLYIEPYYSVVNNEYFDYQNNGFVFDNYGLALGLNINFK